jgi:hypothetical protein
MNEYLPYPPRHARHAEPAELPAIFRGLANLIVIVPSKSEEN